MTNRQTEFQKADRRIDIYTGMQRDRETDRQTGRQKVGQT